MPKEQQLYFDDIMYLSTNDKAMPRENGIRTEIAYNAHKIETSRNNSISYMLGLYERQVALMKELQRQRG